MNESERALLVVGFFSEMYCTIQLEREGTASSVMIYTRNKINEPLFHARLCNSAMS